MDLINFEHGIFFYRSIKLVNSGYLNGSVKRITKGNKKEIVIECDAYVDNFMCACALTNVTKRIVLCKSLEIFNPNRNTWVGLYRPVNAFAPSSYTHANSNRFVLRFRYDATFSTIGDVSVFACEKEITNLDIAYPFLADIDQQSRGPPSLKSIGTRRFTRGIKGDDGDENDGKNVWTTMMIGEPTTGHFDCKSNAVVVVHNVRQKPFTELWSTLSGLSYVLYDGTNYRSFPFYDESRIQWEKDRIDMIHNSYQSKYIPFFSGNDSEMSAEASATDFGEFKITRVENRNGKTYLCGRFIEKDVSATIPYGPNDKFVSDLGSRSIDDYGGYLVPNPTIFGSTVGTGFGIDWQRVTWMFDKNSKISGAPVYSFNVAKNDKTWFYFNGDATYRLSMRYNKKSKRFYTNIVHVTYNSINFGYFFNVNGYLKVTPWP